MSGEDKGASVGEEAPQSLPCAVRYCPPGMRIRGAIPIRPREAKEAVPKPTTAQKKRIEKRKVTFDGVSDLDSELEEKQGDGTFHQSANEPLVKKKAGVEEVTKEDIHEQQGKTSIDTELTVDDLEREAQSR